MLHAAALALAAWTVSAPTRCPDDGSVSIHAAEDGYVVVRLLGDDSHRCLLKGGTYRELDPEALQGRVMFGIDDLAVQWLLVERAAFVRGALPSAQATLEAYYDFEMSHLRAQPIVVRSLERFDLFDVTGPDGRRRTFLVWKAVLGDAPGPQFWVATAHPRGIVVLSVGGRSESASKALVDSYLDTFSSVDAESCAALRKERARPGKRPATPARDPDRPPTDGDPPAARTAPRPS